jgi:hypothetical protein
VIWVQPPATGVATAVRKVFTSAGIGRLRLTPATSLPVGFDTVTRSSSCSPGMATPGFASIAIASWAAEGEAAKRPRASRLVSASAEARSDPKRSDQRIEATLPPETAFPGCWTSSDSGGDVERSEWILRRRRGLEDARAPTSSRTDAAACRQSCPCIQPTHHRVQAEWATRQRNRLEQRDRDDEAAPWPPGPAVSPLGRAPRECGTRPSRVVACGIRERGRDRNEPPRTRQDTNPQTQPRKPVLHRPERREPAASARLEAPPFASVASASSPPPPALANRWDTPHARSQDDPTDRASGGDPHREGADEGPGEIRRPDPHLLLERERNPLGRLEGPRRLARHEPRRDRRPAGGPRRSGGDPGRARGPSPTTTSTTSPRRRKATRASGCSRAGSPRRSRPRWAHRISTTRGACSSRASAGSSSRMVISRTGRARIAATIASRSSSTGIARSSSASRRSGGTGSTSS